MARHRSFCIDILLRMRFLEDLKKARKPRDRISAVPGAVDALHWLCARIKTTKQMLGNLEKMKTKIYCDLIERTFSLTWWQVLRVSSQYANAVFSKYTIEEILHRRTCKVDALFAQ